MFGDAHWLTDHFWPLHCVRQAALSQRPADLVNVFESFLPQLLLYPNPTDPLNGEAAALLMKEPEAYAAKIAGMWHWVCSRCAWYSATAL